MPREPQQVHDKPGTTHAALETPVLLLVFNRPETTQAVMQSLRAVRPTSLYIAADGPRQGRADDSHLCEEARKAAQSVNWDCDVRTIFREENVGCAVNVSTAITWFFEHVEGGIILEDDCVPSSSFFRFCEELLAYYRNESQVMHIAGANLQYGRRRGRASYYFSRYPNVWGWASWRRAWRHYDFSLRPSWKLEDTWSTQWQLSIQKRGGLAVVPGVNLVKNIGFGASATRTHDLIRAAFVEAEQMQFPLRHPKTMSVDRAADRFTYYVNHRLVRYPQLVWVYWLVDHARALFRSFKQWLPK